MGESGFTDRELDVMSILWQLGSGTVAEVRDRLDASLAYLSPGESWSMWIGPRVERAERWGMVGVSGPLRTHDRRQGASGDSRQVPGPLGSGAGRGDLVLRAVGGDGRPAAVPGDGVRGAVPGRAARSEWTRTRYGMWIPRSGVFAK